MPSAIVPAAGAATRFGGGKLIAEIDGQTLLDCTIGVLLRAGIDEVVVVVPPNERWMDAVRLLTDERVRTAVNPDPSRGMFSTIQVGATLVTGAPVAVLPGDMPFVAVQTVQDLLWRAAGTGAIVSPCFEGRRGHPVILPADVCPTILAAPPSSTLKDVLVAHSGRHVDLDVPDRGVVRDVDFKEDLP
jgi:CTP:molybdopterin cytidylyltransferase MocA